MILGARRERGTCQSVAFRVRSCRIASGATQYPEILLAEASGSSLDAGSERPQQDSNLRTRLRRPVLYPLSYGGPVTSKGYQAGVVVVTCVRAVPGTSLNAVASPA
jgi:hypothetical protein